MELCEYPLFWRGYSALYKAIGQFFVLSSPNQALTERKQHQKSLLKALSPLTKPRLIEIFIYLAWIQPLSHAHFVIPLKIPHPKVKEVVDRQKGQL